MANRKQLWIMLGAGAAAIAIAVAVIVAFALNLTGGDSSTNAAIVSDELPPYAHILGDPNAPVTVVEFSDFM